MGSVPHNGLSQPPVELEPESETIESIKSILPFISGDAVDESKGNYLSYRYTGFSMREACELAGIHQQTVQRWRGRLSNHPQKENEAELFIELEKAVTGDQRVKIRAETLQILFARNFHLVLRRDHEILRRAAGLDKFKSEDGETDISRSLSKEDHVYLNRIRAYYTPQQLDVIERLANPNAKDGEFSFADFINKLDEGDDPVSFTATERKIEIEVNKNGSSDLQSEETESGEDFIDAEVQSSFET